ncbi:hypothetical protein GOP47_0021875 [Adiantum capillus-veneris]|uniref:Nucleolus and neural progenitor protein-like N-terminal domain-containing protein n=1 Tax=Adiantum capillus-veneris TaxID=13818 RepID=A0A9D4U8B9_ADICA|nr:hypothetical protein GOP47_0021875 [Adiantum capillus-veneris]
MEPTLPSIKSRLQEAFLQLTNESTIFERLMYKNVNQHRRALYFRRLCQVRRDLRLLQLVKLTELIQNILQCIENNSRNLSLQEGGQQSKETKLEVVDMRRRLYGVAKLLDQMYDPILNASLQVAGLLGQTFFMPFALTALSMLARLRVFILQCLQDVLTIFNTFSEWASKKELIDHNFQALPISVTCKWDGERLFLAATSTHHQHDSVNKGFVEDQHGHKYTVFKSPVLGDTGAEDDGAPNEGVIEIMQSPGLTATVKEADSIGRYTTNNPQTPILEDSLPPNQGANVLPSLPPRENNAKADHFMSVPKVAYVSVLPTTNVEVEKEETPPLKKQKTDSLFDMLLGLGDGTQRSLF